MDIQHEDIKRFIVASHNLLNPSVKLDELTTMERGLIQHYVSMIAAKFPAVTP
ncbi:MAG: hypothetical protein H8K03_19855 [Nitrospira sp.]|jgi:hypothetical protein|nr:hypothetical protein [Nitrospira sp. BO4]